MRDCEGTKLQRLPLLESLYGLLHLLHDLRRLFDLQVRRHTPLSNRLGSLLDFWRTSVTALGLGVCSNDSRLLLRQLLQRRSSALCQLTRLDMKLPSLCVVLEEHLEVGLAWPLQDSLLRSTL